MIIICVAFLNHVTIDGCLLFSLGDDNVQNKAAKDVACSVGIRLSHLITIYDVKVIKKWLLISIFCRQKILKILYVTFCENNLKRAKENQERESFFEIKVSHTLSKTALTLRIYFVLEQNLSLFSVSAFVIKERKRNENTWHGWNSLCEMWLISVLFSAKTI